MARHYPEETALKDTSFHAPPDISLSQHSRARMQQRGVPQPALELLVRYGTKEHDHKGSKILYFSHRSMRRIARELGDKALTYLDKSFDLYAVMGDNGEIITVGHRYRRILRDRKPVQRATAR